MMRRNVPVANLSVALYPGSWEDRSSHNPNFNQFNPTFNPTFNPVNSPVNSPVNRPMNDLSHALSPYNSGNWSSPHVNEVGGGINSIGPYVGYSGLSPYMYGGYGALSPYMYGGYGGYMGLPFGSSSTYMEPWDYYDPEELDYALQTGYISAPQYNQIILMLDGRRRRHSMFPCFRRRHRSPYRRMMMNGPGLGLGGLGRRGWLSALDLIHD